MKLCFDSIEEVKEFVSRLKGTRGGKGAADEGDGPSSGVQHTAPQPMLPPQGAQGFAGVQNFTPPGGAAQQGGSPFPAAQSGGMQVDPNVIALVGRIVGKTESSIQAGVSKIDAVTEWYRGQLGPEAANATWDQIKGSLLPKASLAVLENLAKVMGAF